MIIHLYLSLPRYGVLKHEVRALCDILIDIITLGREQEVLVGVVGKRWGRCGGHWLVTGIPAPVATGRTAVASGQPIFPNPVGWLWNCSWKNTHIHSVNLTDSRLMASMSKKKMFHIWRQVNMNTREWNEVKWKQYWQHNVGTVCITILT